MWFISIVVKNIWHRKLRSLLTGTSLSLAVCAVAAMLGTAEGYEKSFSHLYENQGADLVVVRAGVTQRMSSSMDEQLAGRLLTVAGVKRVEPVLADLVSFENAQLVAVYIFGLGPDSSAMGQMHLVQGRKLGPEDHRRTLLGQMLAQNLGKAVGDHVEIEGDQFEVVGIFDSYSVLETNGAVVPLPDLQDLMGRPHQVTNFILVLEDSPDKTAAVERVHQEIEAIREFGGKPVRLSARATRDHVKTTFEIQVLKGLAWASSTLALLTGLVSMLNTMMMSVSERIREIATLRAVGWKRQRVLRMILSEALLLAAAGAALGIVLAVPLMHFLANFRLTSGVVVTQLNPAILGKSVGLGILAGLLGAFYPAFIAAHLSPALALRHE